MLNIDKTYCLHYVKLKDRKRKLLKDFEKLQMNVEWVELFDAEEIKTQYKYTGMNEKELSLFLKHKYCIQQQVIRKFKNILVLEDDVDFDSIKEPIEFMNKVIAEFKGDIVWVGGNSKRDYEDKFLYPYQRSRWTHAYILNFSGANKIVEKLNVYDKPIDHKYDEILKDKKIISYWTTPYLKQLSNESHRFPKSLI